MPAMIDEPDIYRCALALVKLRGPQAAKAKVMQRLASAMKRKSVARIAAWHRVLRAIKELQRTAPLPGEPVN